MTKFKSIEMTSLFWWSIPGFKGKSHCCLCLAADSKGALILPLSGSSISDKSSEIIYKDTKFWFSKDTGFAASDKLEWWSWEECPELKFIKSGWIEKCSKTMWDSILDAAEKDFYEIPKSEMKGWAKKKIAYAASLYSDWCSKS